MKKVLVTGGLGYIGSHTIAELSNYDFEIIIVDNLSNSQIFILDRLEKICNKKITFYNIDLCVLQDVETIFKKEIKIDIVIHFAALKSVNDSISEPLKYYNNNINSLLNILHCMEKYNCNNIVFSSSCTVYGKPIELPVKETTLIQKSTSAYGSTKQICEDIIEKTVFNNKIKAISLRYFNPVGAHKTALIGELPIGKPANLMPFITQTAIGKQKCLSVWGNDYNTPDGSCIRDYIHVTDLAQAHIVACNKILEKRNLNNLEVYNIGTGKGISVFEMISIFEKENNLKINYKIAQKREGDIACIFADVSKAKNNLNWSAKKSIKEMVIDSWNWEKSINTNI